MAAGARSLADLPNLDWRQAELVAFDEANLLGGGLVDICADLLATEKRVVVSGLDMDFRGVPFAPMPTMMALADNLVKLTAVCTVCGDDATRTQRLVEGRPARRGDPVFLVGGSEAYEARCPTHHEVAP